MNMDSAPFRSFVKSRFSLFHVHRAQDGLFNSVVAHNLPGGLLSVWNVCCDESWLWMFGGGLI